MVGSGNPEHRTFSLLPTMFSITICGLSVLAIPAIQSKLLCDASTAAAAIEMNSTKSVVVWTANAQMQLATVFRFPLMLKKNVIPPNHCTHTEVQQQPQALN